jgi:predicted nucleotidyltransferase
MDSPRKPEFERLLVGLTRFLDASGIPFMVVGGQAVLLHGVPRTTEDIDLTLGIDASRFPEVAAVCSRLGLDLLPDDPEAFARETFVLPAADPESLVRIDFIFSSLTYEREAIARAVRVRLGDVDVPFISVEDLILHKLFAGRARDREDINGILAVRSTDLDWSHLERWAAEFASIPGREDLPGIVQDLHLRHRP